MLKRWDTILFAVLTFGLMGTAVFGSMANLQTDAIDYYAMVQRLVGDAPPILPDLPFVAQRSPGYPLLTVPMYYVLGLPASFIEAQAVFHPSYEVLSNRPPLPSETALLPPVPIKMHDIFFKDSFLPSPAGIVRWRILAAMLLTGYSLCFSGLWISGQTLKLLYPTLPGRSLMPLMAWASVVFMDNLLRTPAYATLTAFGVACWAAYAWVQAWETDSAWMQALSGLALGFLVLVRLETVLLVIGFALGLFWTRRWRFLGFFTLGGLIPASILLTWNTVYFGHSFHTGILRGTVNVLTFEAPYIWAALFNPRAGLIWHSPLVMVGLVGLWINQEPKLRIAGWAGLALVILVVLRVPVMYFCLGQGARFVEGVLLTCPPDWTALLALIRSDVNRYVIPLMPITVLGLRAMLEIGVSRMPR